MTLIPIEHERRLASAAEAEVFFRAIGETRVIVCGFHTTDPERVARIVDAVDPKREHTINFGAGALGPAAWDALATLAASAFGYLEVRTPGANLRVWPGLRTWVEGERALELETKSIPDALARFREKAGDRVRQGFVSGLAADTRPALVRFLREIGADVHARLDVALAVARALTELHAGEAVEWQADAELLVDFPEGRIHGYMTTPNVGDADQAKWQARVTRALASTTIA